MKHIPRPTNGTVQEVMQTKEHRLVQAIAETVMAFGTRGVRLPWIAVSELEWKMLFNEAQTGGYLHQGPVVGNGYPSFYVMGVKILCVSDTELNIDSNVKPRQIPRY